MNQILPLNEYSMYIVCCVEKKYMMQRDCSGERGTIDRYKVGGLWTGPTTTDIFYRIHFGGQQQSLHGCSNIQLEWRPQQYLKTHTKKIWMSSAKSWCWNKSFSASSSSSSPWCWVLSDNEEGREKKEALHRLNYDIVRTNHQHQHHHHQEEEEEEEDEGRI